MVLLRLCCGSRDMRHIVSSSVPPRNTAALMPAGEVRPENSIHEHGSSRRPRCTLSAHRQAVWWPEPAGSRHQCPVPGWCPVSSGTHRKHMRQRTRNFEARVLQVNGQPAAARVGRRRRRRDRLPCLLLLRRTVGLSCHICHCHCRFIIHIVLLLCCRLGRRCRRCRLLLLRHRWSLLGPLRAHDRHRRTLRPLAHPSWQDAAQP